MMKDKLLIPVFFFLICPELGAQNRIYGQITLDSVWQPVVYLSIIKDFDEMNSISNEMIIEKADINTSGSFVLNTEYLPEGDNFYRFHIARKNDPPASLIIGGREENHFFLIINKKFPLQIVDTNSFDFIKDAVVTGYAPNIIIDKINDIASFLDSTGFSGSYIKADLIKSAVYNKLRSIADTCTNPLASLYALYKSSFEKDYEVNKQFYKDYLSKWRKERSSYFDKFRKKLPATSRLSTFLLVLSCILFTLAGGSLLMIYFKHSKKERNPVYELTVQERKIYALISEGKSNKEISELLNISLSTVKSHINNIYSKLNIYSRKDILNLNLEMKEKSL